MAPKSKRAVENTLRPDDPDAITTKQARTKYGHGTWRLYHWHCDGIPALGGEKLPTGMKPGQGHAKGGPERIWCGRTLQRAREAMQKPIPEGYGRAEKTANDAGISKGLLRRLDSAGQITPLLLPVNARGRTLRKFYPVDTARTYAYTAPPNRWLDKETGEWWITGRAAEKVKRWSKHGLTYKKLFRWVSNKRVPLTNEAPDTTRKFDRTYFRESQLDRWATAKQQPTKAKPILPYVDADGEWYTIMQTVKAFGAKGKSAVSLAVRLQKFWDEKTGDRAGSLSAKWAEAFADSPGKKWISSADAGAKKRHSAVRAFDRQTAVKLAGVLGFAVDFGDQKPKRCTATKPKAKAKGKGGRPTKWDHAVQEYRKTKRSDSKLTPARFLTIYGKCFSDRPQPTRQQFNQALFNRKSKAGQQNG